MIKGFVYTNLCKWLKKFVVNMFANERRKLYDKTQNFDF